MAFQLPQISKSDLEQLPSPSMVVFLDRVHSNMDSMIRMAGSVDRLRPHCKTHKMEAIVRMLIEKGVHKHKAATIAEVEMLAEAGATDVLLAYNPVGPNIARVVQLAKRFPNCRLTVTADHAAPVAQLSAAAAQANVKVGVLLDVNVGQNRTGLDPDSPAAIELYRTISKAPGLKAAGFHVYDGHQRSQSLDERKLAVAREWERVQRLRKKLSEEGYAVPTLVCGGTPTFPVYAEMTDPAIELSPGTCIFHDAGYGSQFADLPFSPAAAVVTRVVSRPAPDRMTLDVGNKAIAADPPRGARVYFPEMPDSVQDIHNEEHLVLITELAARYQPGDALTGIPMHVCPTSALYDRVYVVENGAVVAEWTVTARNRRLTI